MLSSEVFFLPTCPWATGGLTTYLPTLPSHCGASDVTALGTTKTTTRPSVCAICSSYHEKNTCLAKYKAKEAVNHKSPTCSGRHHDWNPSFPARLQRINQGRERQVAWVQQHRTTSSSAPPGTFVWGQQLWTSPPAPSAPSSSRGLPSFTYSSDTASFATPHLSTHTY